MRNIKSLNMMLLNGLQSIKAPFVPLEHSTLNEAFELGLQTPPGSAYPELKYLAIGRGGAGFILGGDGQTRLNYKTHSASDSVLFDHIPFITRPVSSDLSPIEQNKYRLRVLETYDGSDYFSYYLKVIDPMPTTSAVKTLTLNAGVVVSEEDFVSSISRLTPTPVDLSGSTYSLSQGKHLVVIEIIDTILNSTEIDDIKAASLLKYGDAEIPTISEAALVGGFDYSVTTTLGGTNVTYTEGRCLQIMGFITIFKDLTQITSLPISIHLTESQPYPPVLPE